MSAAPLTARQWWTNLASPHSYVLRKAEEYAALTIPSLLLPESANTDTQESSTQSGSIGALLVTSLTNKMMMAMFAPSRPAQRLEVKTEKLNEYIAKGLTPTALAATLAEMERAGARVLNAEAVRPKLYLALSNLIVAGNVLLYTPAKGDVRVLALPYFRVKRTIDGRVHTAVVREEISADELDTDVREAAGLKSDDMTKKEYFRLISLQPDGRYLVSQWVDDARLGPEFDSRFTKDDLPYNFLTWRRADDANYGTSHCEDYAADLRSASVLATSTVDGAVVGTEIRWYVHPSGMTKVDDVAASRNGDALAGRPEDVEAKTADNSRAVQLSLEVGQHWEKRLSQAFLLTINVIRDAERVTAEEIRLLAQELETALGGTYSTLSVSLQKPLATWCLARAGFPITGTDIEVVVITGLDALSRGSDLANLMQALTILAQLAQLPPMLLQRLDTNAITAFVGQGVGIDMTPFFLSPEQIEANQAAESGARVAEETATAAGVAAAQGQA